MHAVLFMAQPQFKRTSNFSKSDWMEYNHVKENWESFTCSSQEYLHGDMDICIWSKKKEKEKETYTCSLAYFSVFSVT